MIEVAEVLERAAKLIERDGWSRYEFTAPNGARCADGAVTAASNELGAYNSATALAALRDQVGGSVWIWNDAPVRTAQQVIDKLREVAELERAR